MTLDIPGDVEVLNCENIVLLEIPLALKTPGFIMVIFGAQSVAVYHLSATIKPDFSSIIGVKGLARDDDTAADSKVSLAKLVSTRPAMVAASTAQYTFMLGWSKTTRLEQLKLDVSKASIAGENALTFSISS